MADKAKTSSPLDLLEKRLSRINFCVCLHDVDKAIAVYDPELFKEILLAKFEQTGDVATAFDGVAEQIKTELRCR